MAYGYFKDLKKRTAADKEINHLILLKIPNMIDFKEGQFLWFIIFSIKRLKGVVSLRLQINLQLNLHLKMAN